MKIISRAEWGARPARRRVTLRVPTPELWLHHTASEQHGKGGVRAIQAYHMDVRGWQDIAYSFLVDDDGSIYEGRGAGVVGGHTAGHNSKSHAICLMGNMENRPPTQRAVDSVRWLRDYGDWRGWWPAHFTGGHRQASGASTACPGRYGMELLTRLRQPATPQEDDDMTPEQDRLLRQLVEQSGNMHHLIVVPDIGLDLINDKLDRLTEEVAALRARVGQ